MLALSLTKDDVISYLRLEPHPEGGWYREIWRGSDIAGRASGTSIYFLLSGGAPTRWHRVDATEIFHFHAGAPVRLSVADSLNGPRRDHRLGIDISAGEEPQCVISRGTWQSAETLGNWSLLGCSVTPGFMFDGFELAPENWRIEGL
ncbi:MAG: cupin domain-containing protein [Alphaproteobacteria bacterium]|nr:cupin domain-containing protein [Alphaproteobacteria bacterium]